VVLAASAFALSAGHPAGLFVTAFLVGAACLVTAPALQARLIEVAPGAQLMGAAINQSATNIGNSLGAALGGLVIARGLGYTAPAWVGAVLAAAGVVVAVISFRLDRRPAAPAVVPDPDARAAVAHR
jgi:DHA1 family inner membrane transport protein